MTIHHIHAPTIGAEGVSLKVKWDFEDPESRIRVGVDASFMLISHMKEAKEEENMNHR